MGLVENEISSLKQKMDQVLENFTGDLATFNLGQASVATLENVKVPYYGSESLLKSLANIAVLDILNLVIEPFDPNTKADIVQGLKIANLGGSIIEEGNRIRINFPPMSSERKEEIIKLMGAKKEETKVVLRRMREEVWEKIQNQEKNKQISEDDRYRAEENLNKLIAEYNQKAEDILKNKAEKL
ncbi:MAG: ribosome recycling factor [Patescibacteria group bacterium]|nr:ribosome recycling factor [Patescibacteria group bacterium]